MILRTLTQHLDVTEPGDEWRTVVAGPSFVAYEVNGTTHYAMQLEPGSALHRQAEHLDKQTEAKAA